MKFKLNQTLLFAGILTFASCGKPVANFTYSGETITAPARVTFENTSKKADTYVWDFGDGTSSEEVSPSHEFNSSGNYSITLNASKGGKKSSKVQRIVVEPPTDCMVLIETDLGNMKVKLYDATPKHRDNFIKLVEDGFYDDLLFHRVIHNFMVQGGDPDSRNAKPGVPLGVGGPGYTIPAEFVDTLVHTRGALAAARQGDQVNPNKESSGSQFYLVHGNVVADRQLDAIESRFGKRYTAAARKAYLANGGTPHLDHNYTVFGQVVEGLDVLEKIAESKTNKRAGDRPEKDIKMKITVIK